MRSYTKGQRGPESTNTLAIQHMSRSGSEANPMVKGTGLVDLRNGKRMVAFLAQGKNARALDEAVKSTGQVQQVTMRWTGREAVTVTAVPKAA